MDVHPNGFVDGGLVGVFIDLVVAPVPWYLVGGWTAPLHLSAGIINLPPEGLVMLPLDDW